MDWCSCLSLNMQSWLHAHMSCIVLEEFSSLGFVQQDQGILVKHAKHCCCCYKGLQQGLCVFEPCQAMMMRAHACSGLQQDWAAFVQPVKQCSCRLTCAVAPLCSLSSISDAGSHVQRFAGGLGPVQCRGLLCEADGSQNGVVVCHFSDCLPCLLHILPHLCQRPAPTKHDMFMCIQLEG